MEAKLLKIKIDELKFYRSLHRIIKRKVTKSHKVKLPTEWTE
jgi:hypothetical protein